MSQDELFSVIGPAHWAQVQAPDRKFVESEKDPKLGGYYKVNVELDEENERVVKEHGLAHLIKFQPPSTDERDPTETGYKYIPVRRRENYKKDGEYFAVKKPKVEKDGQPFDGLIGNGSIVEVLMKTYYSPKMKKKYVNLLKTTVLELVEYEAPVVEDAPEAPKATGTDGEVVE